MYSYPTQSSKTISCQRLDKLAHVSGLSVFFNVLMVLFISIRASSVKEENDPQAGLARPSFLVGIGSASI
jgi:hypothetical protein